MHLNSVGSQWLRRYAVFVACCTFGLLIAGALVASNDAALSVPDWPLSWGHLVPTLEGGIRYEFAHRVAAMLVGLLTVGLAVWMQWGQSLPHGRGSDGGIALRADTLPALQSEPLQSEPRPSGSVTRLAWAAVAVVVAQAALGGVAVRFVTPAWATIAHASLGQLFFGIMVAICVKLYAGFPRSWAAPTLLCTVALFLQAVLGAGVRYGVVAGVVHIAGAALAMAVVMWAALSILMQHTDDPKLRRPAMLLLSITFSQVFLGIAAMMTRIVYAGAPQPMPVMVWFTVAHVAVGSLALGASVALAMLVRPEVFLVNGRQVTA
jgi:cytochrome c oxidase assembly protein subunit 15